MSKRIKVTNDKWTSTIIHQRECYSESISNQKEEVEYINEASGPKQQTGIKTHAKSIMQGTWSQVWDKSVVMRK